MPTEIRGLDRLGGALSLFITELGEDAKYRVQLTARQLATDFTLETPPFITNLDSGQTGIASNRKVAKDTGIAAIRHDLLNCVTPVSEIFDSAFKNKYVEKIIRNKNATKLQGFIDKMPKLKGFKVVPFSEHLHTDERKRGSRYRIPKSKRQITFDERELRRYQLKLEKRVGYSKASWAFMAVALGGKAVAWISRHFGYVRSNVKINIDNPANPTVEMTNETPGITNYISRYNHAIQMRADLMLKDFNRQVQERLKQAALN